MSNTAFLFPGQGSQIVGMGKELAEQLPQVRQLYDQAAEILNYDLASLCFDGPEEQLNATEHSQPALFVTSLAALESLKHVEPALVARCGATAGLSLGEYTSLVFAGVMDFADGLQVVRQRGLAMQAAADAEPSGMVSILGLEQEEVEHLCASCRQDGEIIQLGTPEEIVDSPKDEFVQVFTRGISKTRVLPISRIMEPPCCVASRDDSPKSVMQTMETSNPPYVFITDENQECVGIATKAQIASCDDDQQDSLQNVDAHQPQAISMDASIEKALPLIIGHEFPIPITNDQGELLGMASQSAILEVIAQSAKDNVQPVESVPARA